MWLFVKMLHAKLKKNVRITKKKKLHFNKNGASKGISIKY